MKHISILLSVIMLVGTATALAQETSCCPTEMADSVDIDTIQTDIIQSAIDASIALRDAAATGDTAALMQSARDLRECEIVNFNSLRCNDDTIHSMNGHLVFDEEFAESLASGQDAYQQADEMNRSSTHRGQTANGSILTRTCMVKAGKSTKYTFASKGHQELAVVAEAGGLVTMRIHVTNSAGLDTWYNDTRDVRKGRPQRKTSFELPNNRRNTVELEVINCTGCDISFVVISN